MSDNVRGHSVCLDSTDLTDKMKLIHQNEGEHLRWYQNLSGRTVESPVQFIYTVKYQIKQITT